LRDRECDQRKVPVRYAAAGQVRRAGIQRDSAEPGRRHRLRSLGAWPGGIPDTGPSLCARAGRARTRLATPGWQGPPDAFLAHGCQSARCSRARVPITASWTPWCWIGTADLTQTISQRYLPTARGRTQRTPRKPPVQRRPHPSRGKRPFSQPGLTICRENRC
jgi:hypothetical protein